MATELRIDIAAAGDDQNLAQGPADEASPLAANILDVLNQINTTGKQQQMQQHTPATTAPTQKPSSPTPAQQPPKPPAPPPATVAKPEEPEGDHYTKKIGNSYGVFNRKKHGPMGGDEGIDVFGSQQEADALAAKLNGKKEDEPAKQAAPPAPQPSQVQQELDDDEELPGLPPAQQSSVTEAGPASPRMTQAPATSSAPPALPTQAAKTPRMTPEEQFRRKMAAESNVGEYVAGLEATQAERNGPADAEQSEKAVVPEETASTRRQRHAKKAAKERLEKAEEEEAIDQEMRAMDEEYRAKAELKDAYEESAQATRELAQAAREEKAAMAQMTEEEKVNYLAEKEAKRQMQTKAVSKRTDEIRREQDAEYAEEARKQDEREERSRQAEEDRESRAKQEEEDRPANERSKKVAMVGAAVGGATGRALGFVAKLMQPATQRGLGYGKKKKEEDAEQKPVEDDEDAKDAKQKTPEDDEELPGLPPAQQAAPADDADRIKAEEEFRDKRQAEIDRLDAEYEKAGKESDRLSALAKTDPTQQKAADEAAEREKDLAAQHAAASRQKYSPKKEEEDEREDTGAADQTMAAQSEYKDDKSGEGAEKAQKDSDAIAARKKNRKELAAAGGDVRMALAIEAVSAFGAAAKATANSVNELSDRVKRTSREFGQYSGVLATQNAQQDVTQLMRDINNAQRFGEVTAGANEARFDMEQKIQDITNRFIPFIMKMAENIFRVLEGTFSVVDSGIKMILRGIDACIAALQRMIYYASLTATEGPALLQEIRNMIRDMLGDNNAVSDAEMWNRFMDLGENSFVTLNPNAPQPQPAIQMP